MGNRGGDSCVIGGTSILLAQGGEERIEDIPVLVYFDSDDDKLLPTGQNEIVPIKTLNKTGGEVFPLLRYQGTEDKPMIKIEAQNNHGKYCLRATEWHPVMLNEKVFTQACLLVEGDKILTETGIAEVTLCDPVLNAESPYVYSFALGDGGALEEYRIMARNVSDTAQNLAAAKTPLLFDYLDLIQRYNSEQIEDKEFTSYLSRFRAKFLEGFQEAKNFEQVIGLRKSLRHLYRIRVVPHSEVAPTAPSSSFMGLNRKQHIYYNNKIACGSYTLQYQLIEQFRKGIPLDSVLVESEFESPPHSHGGSMEDI